MLSAILLAFAVTAPPPAAAAADDPTNTADAPAPTAAVEAPAESAPPSDEERKAAAEREAVAERAADEADTKARLEQGGAGVAGNLIDPNDPNAQRAKSDLEGEALEKDRKGVPERLPKFQRAGWWTVLGTLTLASAGGVMAGLVERQEAEARRLALGIDLSRGARFEYASVADNYEQMLKRGRSYQGAARGLFIGAGIAAAASITLFAIDAKRRKRDKASARVQVGPGAVEVSF